MSSLTTTTINTANGDTPLTITTGNTSGPSIIVGNGTDIVIRANATSNVFVVNSVAVQANAAFSISNTLNVTGQLTINAVANGANFAGNTTFANVVATSVRTTNTVVTTNTLTLGTSSIATSGYTRLPNGLLLQWGSVTSVTTAGTTVTFPVTFAAAPYSITVTGKSAQYGFVTSSTASTFFLDSSGTSDYFYMAIGI